ncbi:hypothetical protein FC52_GL000308 [Lactobacillus pasteurii DSM 23907 = CRBIP 24.76]|uniref:Cysteine-rich CPCC domain-containing protein n=2 Tax=Lactobacillus pasteurii TaxID=872327 RepID=I7KLE8_9LACO|nr:hypothetical protein FC52_GL000308 [Lactobacillus pasteurii DSM 23907 = CRBIP 24.76]CCI85339.1 Putative uncharacterized protein [Lactobacillus pasteurii DSM 23907 = CRBIP 24.76]
MQKTWKKDGETWLYCPVCGKEVRYYDICFNCGWQNTGPINHDGGPNKLTLAEAKEAYAKGEVINRFLFGDKAKNK